MKDRSCARCDWHPDPTVQVTEREQAAEHARSAGHWLCSVCTFSLDETERAVCERCLSRAQSRLKQVVELYALLPAELDHPSAHAALVLLGPGSAGTAFRDMTRQEWRDQAGATDHKLHLPGREHGVDNKPEHGVAVVFVLGSWENDWRDSRGEEPANESATVAGIAGYLERRMRWAANGERGDVGFREPHPAFAEFAIELAELVQQMEEAGHRDDRPDRAPVACFDCSRTGSLHRAYRAPDPCEHRRPDFPPAYELAVVGAGPAGIYYELVRVPLDVRRAEHEVDLKRWRTEHARCDQGGLSAQWSCRVCGREYTDEEYMLALAHSMKVVATSECWGLPWEIAASLGLPVKTVRTWVDRCQVTSMCDVESQRIMVWWPDAWARATRRAARQRKESSA